MEGRLEEELAVKVSGGEAGLGQGRRQLVISFSSEPEVDTAAHRPWWVRLGVSQPPRPTRPLGHRFKLRHVKKAIEFHDVRRLSRHGAQLRRPKERLATQAGWEPTLFSEGCGRAEERQIDCKYMHIYAQILADPLPPHGI